jgi:hypothetical protein
MPEAMKPLSWIGSSYDDFTAFPAAVQHDMGFAPNAAIGIRAPSRSRVSAAAP